MHWLPILFGYDAFWNVATILALSPVSYLLGKLAVAGVRRLPRRRPSRARAARFLLLARRLVALLVLLLALALPLARASGDSSSPATPTPDTNCGLARPAFCDTFDAPVGGAERSGDLDGVVWGASRVSTADNIGQGMADRWSDTAALCGDTGAVAPPKDIRVCGGQLVEGLTDGHQVAMIAMYPRQPFDIAGRVGTVAFDVSALSQGPHAEWPAFVYTDQPVPAPDGEISFTPAVADDARNSVGFALSGLCASGTPCYGDQPSGDGSNCVTVNDMWVTRSYTPASLPFTATGCVLEATAGGPLNHVQVRMSQGDVQVWGTDPGGSTFREIAAAASANLPLTRGLIWLEDVHYNADKFNTQMDTAISWDNVGFDGPVLPRDLGVELPDNTTRVGGNSTNLGYVIPQTGSVLTETFQGASNVGGASAALLEFTAFPWTSGDVFSYAFNGHAIQTATPVMGAFAQQTVALSVPLSDLQNGDNTLTISDDQEALDAANFDLILAGAGRQPPPTTFTARGTVSNGDGVTLAVALVCTPQDDGTYACQGTGK